MAFALGYSPDTARTLLEKSGKMVFKKRDASMTAGINNVNIPHLSFLLPNARLSYSL